MENEEKYFNNISENLWMRNIDLKSILRSKQTLCNIIFEMYEQQDILIKCVHNRAQPKWKILPVFWVSRITKFILFSLSVFLLQEKKMEKKLPQTGDDDGDVIIFTE